MRRAAWYRRAALLLILLVHSGPLAYRAYDHCAEVSEVGHPGVRSFGWDT